MTFEDIFDRVRLIVADKFPVLAETRLEHCEDVEEQHADAPRQYMHTAHVDGVICFALNSQVLAPEHLYGLFFHEFGHLITRKEADASDDADEIEMFADLAVMEHFGLEMRYEGPEDIETIDPAAVDKLFARLTKALGPGDAATPNQ